MVELETLGAFERYLTRGAPLSEAVVQGLDLRPFTEALLAAPLAGAVFLGCTLDPAVRDRAIHAGALIFPALDHVPYHAYRGGLYTPDELFDGFDPARPDTYLATLDARVFAHWRATGGPDPDRIMETLARRLHDHAITNALQGLIGTYSAPTRKVVAIMGGHSMSRASASYRDVALLARALTRRGYFMVSGGGPGAMEATHVGAYFAPLPDDALTAALTHLADAPRYTHPRWLAAAFEVLHAHPLDADQRDAAASLGVPTWHYGHEPPNPFATHIAKYFANSVREDGLLAIARYGVVFSPGSAGTIQEVFQDACQNHYNTVGVVSPMIFLDHAYWSWNKPVFPLIAQLAAGRDYARWLRITDDPAAVIDTIDAFARHLDDAPDAPS